MGGSLDNLSPRCVCVLSWTCRQVAALNKTLLCAAYVLFNIQNSPGKLAVISASFPTGTWKLEPLMKLVAGFSGQVTSSG